MLVIQSLHLSTGDQPHSWGTGGTGRLTTILTTNCDDNYSLNYANYSQKSRLSRLVRAGARSWQYGGQASSPLSFTGNMFARISRRSAAANGRQDRCRNIGEHLV